MRFQRHADVGTRSQEAPNKEFGVPRQAEDFKLDSMHQSMKKGSKGNITVKHQNILKSQRSHMGELGQVRETLRPGFGIKGRVRHVAFFQNDESDLLQQRGVKEGCHRSAAVLAERPCSWPEEFPLPVQVVSNLADRLSNSRFI